MIQPASFSINEYFAGKSILLTGTTGFLAKAVMEKVLRDLPAIKQIYLLIRPRVKADGSRVPAQERLREEILRNSAFARLRETLGEQFDSFCQSKITCIAGDLTSERLGLDEAAFKDLASKVDVIMNSAATVVFDERLDLALDLNTMGPQRLMELAHAGKATYVHISTAYVSGKRTGRIPEKLLDPLEAIDKQLPPGVPRPERFDVVEEIARLDELAKTVKQDCLKLLQQKGISPESEDGINQLRTALVSAGMRRAQSLGWNDTYTYTKFLGEQLIKLKHGKIPTVIVRPSIIESSLREPEPGWLDGLRMADPIIIGFGKGRLADFPADKNVALDIIPADLVVNTILAAGAYIATQPGGFDLFTIASSSENPLIFRALYDHVRDYFKKHPMTDRAGKPVAVPEWNFPTIDQYRRRMHNRYLRPIRAANVVLNSPIPLPGARRMRSKLRTLNSTLEQLLYYVDIYGPYVNLQCRFETTHCRELLEGLKPDERERFDFDPRKIRWRNYLQDVHIPGLKRNILRMDTVPRAGAGEGHLLDDESEKVKRRGASSVRGTPQTVVDLCARGAERFGNKSLVEIRRASDAGPVLTRISYAEMFERSGQLARLLIARLGLHPGDRIALLGENCPEWALAYMAISRACCTAVPLDRSLPPAEAARLIRIVDAKGIIISPSLFKTAAADLGPGSGLAPCLNMFDNLNPHPGAAWTYPEASIGDRPLKDPAPEMLASILFTSGTTQDCKGVMLSHGNVVADALSVAEVLEPMETDRFLSVLPLHHAFEFTCGFLIPMYGGATIHHIEFLRPKDISDTMKLAEVTVVLGVPRLFQLFMSRIKTAMDERGSLVKAKASVGRTLAATLEFAGSANARKMIFKEIHEGFGGALRLFVSGGAPLDAEIFNFFKSVGITIAEGYGLTETAPVLTVNPLTAPKAGSVGPPVPGVEIRIANENHDGIGEVLARGATIMQGYWHNPAATEKAFDAGWFKTGDLGKLDKDGYLHITGRLKDVIVTQAGKNVYPDEVEAQLRGIAGVKEMCVIGLPSRAGKGEEVAVVVVLDTNGKEAEVRGAIERASQNLSSHQRVARIEFQRDDLPKTSTLKVQRNKVRERYKAAGGAMKPITTTVAPLMPAADAGSSAPSVWVEVARAVAEVSEGRVTPAEVTPDMKLQIDLAFDSIARVDLLQKIELKLNIQIPQEAEGRIFTVKDVVDIIEATLKAGGKPVPAGEGILTRSKVSVMDEVQSGMKESLSKTVLQGVFSTTASVFMNTYLRVVCYGLDNIPRSGPYILAANHCSHLDSVAIREVVGGRAAGLHVMGARDYFFNTALKSWFFTTFLNALPFDREENSVESLAACKKVLETGRAILLFPEGTRSVTGELQQFKSGIGVLAVELDVPIIPVHLHGTFASLPKGRSLPRPTRIEVRIGHPMWFKELKAARSAPGASTNKLYREAANQLRAQIEHLGNLPPESR